MTTRTIDKAFLRYYDANGFGKRSANDVRIAKLAFVAGYETALQTLKDSVLLGHIVESMPDQTTEEGQTQYPEGTP